VGCYRAPYHAAVGPCYDQCIEMVDPAIDRWPSTPCSPALVRGCTHDFVFTRPVSTQHQASRARASRQNSWRRRRSPACSRDGSSKSNRATRRRWPRPRSLCSPSPRLPPTSPRGAASVWLPSTRSEKTGTLISRRRRRASALGSNHPLAVPVRTLADELASHAFRPVGPCEKRSSHERG
jgi:hypothetical protein